MSGEPYGSLSASISPESLNLRSLEQTIVAGGTTVNYVDMGSGDPPLLLLHGIGASYRAWLSTMPALAKLRRVVAVDLPGFGGSGRLEQQLDAAGAAEYLTRVCEILDLGVVDVVGHSMGGFLAIQLAFSHPERVRRVALVSTTLLGILKFYRHPLAGLIENPVVCSRFIAQVVTASLPIPRTFVDFVINSDLLRPLFFRGYVHDPGTVNVELLAEALSSAGSPRTLAAAMMGFRYQFEDIARAMNRRPERVLLISGTDDRLSSVEDARAFSAMVGAEELVLLPDTGHWPMVERPTTLNDILASWLEST
jgi:pimeloyl-ACP methyl ester carboxylesterase